MNDEKLNLTVNFPLPDGRTLVKGPLTYSADGLFTTHAVDWMREERFAKAYQLAMSSGHRFGADLHIEWRVYLPCWAAAVGIKLEGDFVECGVDTGMFARAICSYVGFERFPDRTLYLLDTYAGYPVEQLTEKERALGLGGYTHLYGDTYELVREHMRDYPNVKLIKGRIPESLADVPATKVACLLIDMNAAVPERAALEFFWDKLVPGAPVVLDDFAFAEHVEQRHVLGEFAASRGVDIFSMPTGQAFLIKPPR
ncbi:MAG TPA: TylF/MycF/NovP-related O-methyltransferase [Candidatus Sulfotelmatobacter sp.]|nr:TylF/MycF/NovP-related O-methyltransferase [Candidatus Sulfotelmatobacter sp.]